MKSIFNNIQSDKVTSARAGIIHTDNGDIKTPFFMPVATYGAVKTQSSQEISEIPSSILLSNTYHLYLRPGIEILYNIGGLHKFMNWNSAILTDSGGFQIFSLESYRKLNDDGVTFRSHLDGSKHHFTPEKIVDIQRIIGSDFMMMLDVCPPGDANKETWLNALKTTTNWARRSINQFNNTNSLYGHSQILIPIIQGGTDKELRKRSALELTELDAKAYAIGGLAVGEPKYKMLETVEWMNDYLPVEKPRYLMGVGTPADLVESVARGIDMFDCVMPTRNARNGQLFTLDGKMNIRNAKYKSDYSMIDENSFSQISMEYSKSYLHHLFKTQEILGYRIATQHNLNFYLYIMNTMREKIILGTFSTWSKKFLERYNGN